ncbi:peptidase U32 family protein [Nanoarchaeota archaeon]
MKKLELKARKGKVLVKRSIKLNNPELLVPAGDWPSLRVAIEKGADSIYFGIKQLNMRATARNFELKDLKKISKLCHDNARKSNISGTTKRGKVKAYLTLNTIIYDDEIKKVEKIIKKVKETKIDAIICWDTSIINLCKKYKVKFHISTQASVSNFEAVKFYSKLGAERIVLARELSLDQIKKIVNKIKKEKLKVKIETFVHGAMCVSVSGRCFISQFLYGKSANRGECIQPCRRSYNVKDKEENHELDLESNFVMSPKDLCALPFLDKLVKAGIDVFKIEGRNRAPEYVGFVTEIYRDAINNIINGKFDKKFIKYALDKLKTVYNKGFSSGFYLGKPINEWSKTYGSKATKKKVYVGRVINYYNKLNVAEIKLESSELNVGDKMLVQGNATGLFDQNVGSIELNHKSIKKGKKGDSVAVLLKRKARKNDMVFKII